MDRNNGATQAIRYSEGFIIPRILADRPTLSYTYLCSDHSDLPIVPTLPTLLQWACPIPSGPTATGEVAGADHRLGCGDFFSRNRWDVPESRFGVLLRRPVHRFGVFTICEQWSTEWELNPQPPAYKAGALPVELSGARHLYT